MGTSKFVVVFTAPTFFAVYLKERNKPKASEQIFVKFSIGSCTAVSRQSQNGGGGTIGAQKR
jgi:hypothetical protein